MAVASSDTAIRSSNWSRMLIYLILLLFALFYLLPFGIMLVNSLKPLEEITGGNMVSLPRTWTIEPWLSAWSTAQIGVEPTGLRPYFINSIMMAVPAVLLSTVVGALNGYVLTKWQFRGSTLVFGVPAQDETLEISPFDVYFDEVDYRGSYSLTTADFERAVTLLTHGRVEVDPIVTDRIGLDDLPWAFDRMANTEGLKHVVIPDSE